MKIKFVSDKTREDLIKLGFNKNDCLKKETNFRFLNFFIFKSDSSLLITHQQAVDFLRERYEIVVYVTECGPIEFEPYIVSYLIDEPDDTLISYKDYYDALDYCINESIILINESLNK